MGFGKSVRRRRESLGLSIEELAGSAGLSTNFLGGIERENRDPSLTTVKKIAKALDVGAGELVGGVRELSAEAVEAGRFFDQLSADDQDTLLRLLRSMARRRRR